MILCQEVWNQWKIILSHVFIKLALMPWMGEGGLPAACLRAAHRQAPAAQAGGGGRWVWIIN